MVSLYLRLLFQSLIFKHVCRYLFIPFFTILFFSSHTCPFFVVRRKNTNENGRCSRAYSMSLASSPLPPNITYHSGEETKKKKKKKKKMTSTSVRFDYCDMQTGEEDMMFCSWMNSLVNQSTCPFLVPRFVLFFSRKSIF